MEFRMCYYWKEILYNVWRVKAWGGMDMNTAQLSCFLAVAEHLNFARAAQQLHITHPAVSQQIRALEKELNVKLFHRTTRVVKLTEEGKVFLNDARQMLEISERAKKRFENTTDGGIQTLALGCYNYPFMFHMADTLKRLRSACPGLHPRLQMVPFPHIYRMLEEGDLDAVVGFYECPAPDRSLVFREIAKVPVVCVCSSQSALAGEGKATLEQLGRLPLVLLEPRKALHPLAQMQGRLVGGRPPSEFYFCESAEAITVLVAANYGVSILPACLVPEISAICKVPLEGAGPVSFGIYYKSLKENRMLKAFVQSARDTMADSLARDAGPRPI